MSNEFELNKDRANADRYYKLFADKAGKFKDGERILFIHIGNFDVLDRFIQSSPNCSYFIIDQHYNGPWFEMNWDCKFIGSNEDDSIIKALETLNMKFDKIIMNPPYSGTLHLKITTEAIKHLNEDGQTVVLAPCPLLSSIRNNWSKLAIEKFNSTEVYQHIQDFEKLDDGEGIKLFNAGIQQHLGIATYSTAIVKRSADCFADKPVPVSLMTKIMDKIESNSIKDNPGKGKYKLPVSGIHGHVGQHDFLNTMNMTYEAQLESKGSISIYFKTEKDRHDFYDFWMSPLGKFIVSLWKVDTHVEPKWIPYYWTTDNKIFYKDFEITEEEQMIIEKKIRELKK